MRVFRYWLAIAALSLSASAAVAAGNTQIPLEHIAALPDFAAPMLSPDGNWVAARMVDRGESVVVVQPFKNKQAADVPPAILRFGDKQVAWYDWANFERLMVGVRVTVQGYKRKHNRTRIFSVKRDGTDIIPIQIGEVQNKGISRGSAVLNAAIINWLDNDPDHVLAILSIEGGEWDEPRVHKVNVNTGDRKLIQRNKKGFYMWVADSAGDLRVGARHKINLGRADIETFYREKDSDDWQQLQTSDYFSDDRIIPYRFDDDNPDILIMTTREFSRDAQRINEVSGLYRYDLKQKKILGEYVNPQQRSLLDTVRGAFPDDHIELVSYSRDYSRSFFRIYSDVRSPEFYLLDTTERRLDYIAAEYPQLANYQLAPMQKIAYEARDGLKIPAFITEPLNAAEGPLPTVVMPHGGPWSHDLWGFDNYVQLLANRGYLVLQPQFRGSTGYGIKHEEAGYGQWGKAIQADITDGVQWLIDNGKADPSRICIVGASFGGYAAAMGLVQTPDLYACGVSVNGVLDLELWLDDVLGYSRITRRVFNSRKDIDTTSPIEQIRAIQAPMLIVGSENDTVVPIRHSQRMFKKLRKQQPDSQYLELEGAEHWRTNEKAELATLAAIDDFLARHLSDASIN